MKYNFTAALAFTALTLSIAACSSAPTGTEGSGTPAAGPSAAVQVKVVTDPATIGAYSPVSATARAGDTVRWTFEDKNPHSVTADDGAFDSTPMAGGKVFTHKFDRPGSYLYHCSIHPEMHGTVVVG